VAVPSFAGWFLETARPEAPQGTLVSGGATGTLSSPLPRKNDTSRQLWFPGGIVSLGEICNGLDVWVICSD